MEHLDAIRDVDLLDDVYTALISGKSQRVVDGLIRQTVETTPLASSASPPPVVESEPSAEATPIAAVAEEPPVAPPPVPSEEPKSEES